MAHRTTEEIDTLAAQQAASITAQAEAAAHDTPPAETTLAYGAQGEDVTKLVNLLAVLGYDTNAAIKGGPPILDESVLVDVRAAKSALNLTSPELLPASEIPAGVKGELVGQDTWNALYQAAEEKLGSEAPPA